VNIPAATSIDSATAAQRAHHIREHLPKTGLFAGHDWRISPVPFPLGAELARELETLGRVLLQFYRSVNLLYRQSAAGKQPEWVARWLDQGKPPELLELQRSIQLKNEVPRVIRPDLLITERGIAITELDSVPGGIGLTAWLNQVYGGLGMEVIGGSEGMLEGFASIFGDARRVEIIVSDESATYRPEMSWLCEQLGTSRFEMRNASFEDFKDGDAVYRFFELFDLANVPNAWPIFRLALEKRIHLTPAPKPAFEEKMLLALLWNRNLQGFWRESLGEGFFARLRRHVPYSWVVDPAPLPPHGAVPELNLTDWQQLKGLSQKERELILKVSGYSEKAWGARGVFLGSDLALAEWSAAVDTAIGSFSRSPFVLQRYHRPKVVPSSWYDFARETVTPMDGRVRLSPYYFVSGEGDAARAQLCGILATICPADKKIIHGMKEAVFAPCAVEAESKSTRGNGEARSPAGR
jgi:hypothetical protein